MSRRNLSLKLTGGAWFFALVTVLIPRGADAQVLTYASGQTMQLRVSIFDPQMASQHIRTPGACR